MPFADLARAARSLPLELSGTWPAADAMIEEVTAALREAVPYRDLRDAIYRRTGGPYR